MKGKTISIMEVCGTHTMSLAKHGIRSLLPQNIKMISGPGCPVCVTDAGDIDASIELASKPNVIVATFGDMLKVPSSKGDSLLKHKNVKICYSPLEALELALAEPQKEIVFLGIGFETTVPLIAATLDEAIRKGIKNFSILPMHKTVPIALKAIFADPEVKVDALLLPGHVSAITGSQYWDFLYDLKVPGVIAGFEAENLLSSITKIVDLKDKNEMAVINNYPTVVTKEGNRHAWSLLEKYFESCDAKWREIGVIPGSGLDLRREYQSYSAKVRFSLEIKEVPATKGCLCGRIMMGKNAPQECPHFAKSCTPSNPVGPCMVSSEGSCAACYKYERK